MNFSMSIFVMDPSPKPAYACARKNFIQDFFIGVTRVTSVTNLCENTCFTVSREVTEVVTVVISNMGTCATLSSLSFFPCMRIGVQEKNKGLYYRGGILNGELGEQLSGELNMSVLNKVKEKIMVEPIFYRFTVRESD